MTGHFVGDWVSALVFFPLWLVAAGTLFGLVSIPKRRATDGGRKWLDAIALFSSIGSAAGALFWLDCSSYIHLPLAESACRVSSFF